MSTMAAVGAVANLKVLVQADQDLRSHIRALDQDQQRKRLHSTASRTSLKGKK